MDHQWFQSGCNKEINQSYTNCYFKHSIIKLRFWFMNLADNKTEFQYNTRFDVIDSQGFIQVRLLQVLHTLNVWHFSKSTVCKLIVILNKLHCTVRNIWLILNRSLCNFQIFACKLHCLVRNIWHVNCSLFMQLIFLTCTLWLQVNHINLCNFQLFACTWHCTVKNVSPMLKCSLFKQLIFWKMQTFYARI